MTRFVQLMVALTFNFVKGSRIKRQHIEFTNEVDARVDVAELEVYDAMAPNETTTTPEPENKWDPSMPKYAEHGRCCYWADRFGRKQYRWFYWEDENRNGSKSYSWVWTCPGKWSKTDGYDCRSKGAYNKRTYKEDSDWVMCCKKGDQSINYFYAGGQPCKERGGGMMSTCTSQECVEHKNVDSADIKCPSTHKKIVNVKATWGCKQGKRLEGHDEWTDMQCAGYSSNCAMDYCIRNSMSTNGKRDCSGWCTNTFARGIKNDTMGLHFSWFAILVALAGVTMSRYV